MISPFLLYIARASLYLAIFYAFYLLVMRRTSLFRFNRIALLIGTVVCHLLPLLRLRTVVLPVSVPVSAGTLETATEPAGASAAPFPWLLVLYAAGILGVLVLCLVSIARTRKIIRGGITLPLDGCRLTLLDRDIPSFSWGRQIIMSRSDYEQYPAILSHELQHVQKHHSLDVLLMTGVATLHWFNPLVWIARAELKLLHEYEADEGLIQKGIDATSYQLLLVRKAVGEQRFSLANGFDHAKLKQRITMMQKKQTPARVRFAYVAVLPVLAATMFVCNPVRARMMIPSTVADAIVATVETAAPDSTDKAVPFAQIEVKPSFQGGDASAFSKWVAQHLQYPKDAREDGIQGRVTVQFTICDDGVVRNVKVLRGVHPSLDAEAVRVISSSPKWEPGKQGGKPVNVTFMFPVIFKADGGDSAQVIKVEGVPLGDGGVPASIFVRGANGADPLILVDGVKLADGQEGLGKIDPKTIESIDVLKDQATIEKYGVEAKDGVILVTTKK